MGAALDSDRKHWVSVAAAMVDGDRYLAIQRRDNGKWEPPGGTLEVAESIEGGLRREVQEETGLIVKPGPLTGIYKNMNRGIVALVFRCDIVGGVLTPNSEAADFRWMTRREVLDLLDPAYAWRLLDALNVRTVDIRIHDGTNLLDEE